MRYVKVIASDDGESRFVDVEVEQAEAPVAKNVPPLRISAPLPAQAVCSSSRRMTWARPRRTRLPVANS